MSVLQRRRRHRNDKPLEVNLSSVVVPMLDMSFQILFFFILNFHPPTNEGQFPFELSTAGGANTQVSMNPDDEVTLVVKSSDNPEHPVLTGWEIETKANTQSFPVAPDAMEKLEEALRRMDKTKANAENGTKATKLKVKLNGKMRHSDVIDAMNVGKKAGFEDIQMEVEGGFLSNKDRQ